MLQRFWQQFKKRRQSVWALCLFGLIAVLCFSAELWVNDKPLLVYTPEKLYFPAWVHYPETAFPGGELPSYADYHDVVFQQRLSQHGGWMIWPVIPWSYNTLDPSQIQIVPSPPSASHWLGTDVIGYDVLAGLIYGMRLSLCFAFILTFFASMIGVLVGAIQGYFGGWIDLSFQRFLEIWRGLPQLFTLIVISSVISPSFWSLLCILLLFSWTELVNLVRAEFMRVRNFDYVLAARALGVSDFTIMWRHMLPNAMVSALTFLPFTLASSMVVLTSLDFLGQGLPADTPSLGRLLLAAKENPQAPWLGISSFVALGMLLSLMVFIGEGVRDALDPRRISTH